MEKNFKLKTSEWFEVKVKVMRLTNKGTLKPFRETYCVEAPTFGGAEERISTEISKETTDFKITGITRAVYGEVAFSNDADAEKYFLCKVKLITINDDGDERASVVATLVQAQSLDGARLVIDEMFEGSIVDFEVASLSESAVLDVYTIEL